MDYSMFLFTRRTDTINSIYRMAYQYLVEQLSDKVDRTRSDVKKIAKALPDHTPGSPDPAWSRGTTPGGDYSWIPLHPQEDQFPNIAHWRSGPWNALRHAKEKTLCPGESLASSGTNVKFWEDPEGNVIPPDQRAVVTSNMRAIWKEMYNDKKELGPKTKISWKVREEFRIRMEALHPWLRLCENHWKVDQLWTNHFSSWRNSVMPTKPKDRGSLKRERSPEEGEAGPSSKKLKTFAPVRERSPEEGEVGPSSRRLNTPVPERPTRPKPTAKVSTVPFIIPTRLLKHI